jgi:purine-binding chemotaxis protein CheW
MRRTKPDGEKAGVTAIESAMSHVEMPGLVPGEGPSLAYADKKRILKARARLLAQEAITEIATEHLNVVEFLLSYERYGIESSYVREVYPLREFTPLPGTPSFILGIINLRGQILSVIDIKKFFDIPEKGLTNLNRVIIVRNDSMEFGILADTVFGTRNIPLKEMQPPPPALTGLRGKYLKGVARGQITILDAQNLLQDNGLIVNKGIR